MQLAEGWFAGASRAWDLPQRHRDTEVDRERGEEARAVLESRGEIAI
jgi:hypothetical protein